MQGRRLPDRDVEKWGDMEPGDYIKMEIGGAWEWFVRPPRGAIGSISKHTVTEHEDGTITVSPSILTHDADVAQQWHGYLERGIWREV